MKFQQGDKVILLHSGEEAEIVDFINREMAMVDVNGVKFPVYLDQIDFPYFKRFTAKPEVQPKKKIYIDEVRKEKTSPLAAYKVGEGVWLSFLPVYDKDVFDDDIVEYFRLYLVNQTSMHLNFSYRLRLAGEVDFELKNDIHPLSDFYLHDVPFEALNDSPRYDFEFSLKNPDKKKAGHVEASLKVKAKQVFARIEESRMKQEASFSYILLEHYPDRPEEEKADLKKLSDAGYKIYEGGKIHKQHLEPARSVLDLHIEKLVDDPMRISKQEMIDIQLKTFEKYYELALLHHLHQMIVIHGVGTGRLRDEIHDILRLKKEVKFFVNQFHPLYGFGATEIYFK
jgi:hypothetical protein